MRRAKIIQIPSPRYLEGTAEANKNVFLSYMGHDDSSILIQLRSLFRLPVLGKSYAI